MSALVELRDRPFELLQAMEVRSRAAAAGQVGAHDTHVEWTGVGFRIGGNLFVAAREDIREVLTAPEVTRVPGAKSWLRGLANIRGQLLPIIDLQEFLGGPRTSAGRGSRVIAVNHPDIPAGLLVDEVRGFRRFGETEHGSEVPDLESSYTPFVAGSFQRGEEIWTVMKLRDLVSSPLFLQAAD